VFGLRGRRGARLTLVWLVLASAAIGSAAAQNTSERAKRSLAPMLKRVTPAVVNISVAGRVAISESPLADDPLFKRFFGKGGPFPQSIPQQSAGSGVIVDAARGWVVTNQHVIANSDEIIVTLADRRRFNAQLVGSDSDTDIALLKIEPDHLTQVVLGDSDQLEVGDTVVAIGNPFALGQTVTSGIVSALGRTDLGIEGYEDFIQTDASINPGNSGGALVDVDGKLVGINTAIVSSGGTEGNVGIGFAVPIKMVQRVTAQLIEHGEVRRGRLGIGIQDVTPDLAKALGLTVDKGAIVTQVLPHSSAARAGFAVDDIIVALDGSELLGAADLRNRIGLTPVGTQVELALLRDGRKQTIKTKIETAAASDEDDDDIFPAGEIIESLRGASLSDLREADPEFGKVSGVLVTMVDEGSPAALNGMQADDIITAVNRHNVGSFQALATALRATTTPLALSVERHDAKVYVVVR